MTHKKASAKSEKENEYLELLKSIKEFSLTIGEECPEGHRKDPRSGACLPMGSTDHTAFTRSLNNDYGPEWRGLKDKENQTFANREQALDAFDMDEPVSCGEGTTFSFVQRKCVSMAEAEVEDSETFARDMSENPVEVADNGHEEVVAKDPEGRRDPVGFECPSDEFFNYARRECIPLNKTTILASEIFSQEFKTEVARYGKVALTSPDPLDGHRHVVTVNEEGEGMTSVAIGGLSTMQPHSHEVDEYEVAEYAGDGGYVSRHPGYISLMDWDYDNDGDPYKTMPLSALSKVEQAKELRSKQRNALPSGSFGVPGKRKFPLHDCSHVRNAMSRFNQAKGLSPAEKSALKSKIVSKAKACGIKVDKFAKASTEAEYAAVALEQEAFFKTVAEPITSKKRKGLSDSSFGVPGKRKFPLDSCGRVRNAMARFNQAKGLSSAEKATLRRKILSRAKACGIEVKNFAKANTAAEFDSLTQEMLRLEKRVMETYANTNTKKGPCPPGMEWAAENKRCAKQRNFVASFLEQADHSDIIALDPEGRKDTPGFKCPSGEIFNFALRKCIPLDPSKKEGTQPGDTTKADVEGPPQRTLVPNPKGRPAKMPEDCPPGTIWMKAREVCIPLDTQDKIKSALEALQARGAKDDKKDSKGGKCAPDEFFNPVMKKCTPKKGGFFKNKSDVEMNNREGLVPPPAGKVKLPEDCPAGTLWSAFLKVCRPLSTQDKIRQGDPGPYDPKDLANMTEAQLIQVLDEMIQVAAIQGKPEKAVVDAKNLPNAAFPPSLIGNSRRSLMHHTADATDPYDSSTVDVSRLRNALARISKLDGYNSAAVAEAREHLLAHARELVVAYLGEYLGKA